MVRNLNFVGEPVVHKFRLWPRLSDLDLCLLVGNVPAIGICIEEVVCNAAQRVS